MESIYVLVGKEHELIQQKKEEIIFSVLSEEQREFNLSVHDMTEVPVTKGLEDANTISFMPDEKKVVVLKDCYFLTAEKGNSDIDHDVDALENYIDNPNPDTVLLLIVPYEKLDGRRKITKTLKKKCQVFEMGISDKELPRWLQDQVIQRGYKIDTKASQKLISLVGNNLSTMTHELNKLCLYKAEKKIITEEDVHLLVTKSTEENIFDMIEKVSRRQIGAALQMLKDLYIQKEDPIKIVALLGNQFRNIFHCQNMKARGYSSSDIASKLKMHPFVVKKALDQAGLFTNEELKKILSKISELDKQMKSTSTDKKLLLDLFLSGLKQ